MFSESMLNNMTGFEIAHYVKVGSVDSLSSDLVMKIVNDYDDRIEQLKEELDDDEKGYDRGYSDAIDACQDAINRLG